MHREHFHIGIPGESFFEEETLPQLWPVSLLGNPAFVEQITTRKRLIQALHGIQSRVNDPTLSLENHIREGKLSEEHVADFYEALADLLLCTPEYGRIILYLPFEYLPRSHWKPSTERLAMQSERLKNAYMQTWEALLRIHDVRANFVDGDVLETEKRVDDLPRVVKAAHFIPLLVQKGWLSLDDVLEMHDETEDDVLRESIADTFGVLHGLGFIKDTGNAIEQCILTPDRLQHDIEERLTRSMMKDEGATKKRQEWLAKVQREKVIEEIGDEMSLLVEQLTLPTAHIPSQLVLIDGTRKAIERAAAKDMSQATLLYAQFQEQLHALWEQKHLETQPYLEKLFFRLHRLGLVDDATLNALELCVPSIGGPFSENLRNLGTEMDDVQRVVTSIRLHPVLRQYVYPVVLMYGSKLKGYGSKHADTDLGVFIKPNTPDDVRTTIRSALQDTLASTILNDAVTEFWLEEGKDGLAVRDFDSHDRSLGSSLWAHVLFGAAWSGDRHAMQELHAHLLPTYFRATEKVMYGRNIRELYLEHLEQDLLQYRLIHKGYHRYYPVQGGWKSAQAGRFDGQSTFWDSGYRAVATKLFIEKVFLPRLSQENP